MRFGGLVLSLVLFPALALAKTRRHARALFIDGKALMAKATTPSCPKLARSHQLDPATGTLLNLATCHSTPENPRAWAAYKQAAASARSAGQTDREVRARHAQALESNLGSPAHGLRSDRHEVRLEAPSSTLRARDPDSRRWIASHQTGAQEEFATAVEMKDGTKSEVIFPSFREGRLDDRTRTIRAAHSHRSNPNSPPASLTPKKGPWIGSASWVWLPAPWVSASIGLRRWLTVSRRSTSCAARCTTHTQKERHRRSQLARRSRRSRLRRALRHRLFAVTLLGGNRPRVSASARSGNVPRGLAVAAGSSLRPIAIALASRNSSSASTGHEPRQATKSAKARRPTATTTSAIRSLVDLRREHGHPGRADHRRQCSTASTSTSHRSARVVSGNVASADTTKSFNDAAAWQAFDMKVDPNAATAAPHRAAVYACTQPGRTAANSNVMRHGRAARSRACSWAKLDTTRAQHGREGFLLAASRRTVSLARADATAWRRTDSSLATTDAHLRIVDVVGRLRSKPINTALVGFSGGVWFSKARVLRAARGEHCHPLQGQRDESAARDDAVRHHASRHARQNLHRRWTDREQIYFALPRQRHRSRRQHDDVRRHEELGRFDYGRHDGAGMPASP